MSRRLRGLVCLVLVCLLVAALFGLAAVPAGSWTEAEVSAVVNTTASVNSSTVAHGLDPGIASRLAFAFLGLAVGIMALVSLSRGSGNYYTTVQNSGSDPEHQPNDGRRGGFSGTRMGAITGTQRLHPWVEAFLLRIMRYARGSNQPVRLGLLA